MIDSNELQPSSSAVDINNWKRKSYFEHYYKNVKCTYNFTVNIDITTLLPKIKERGYKLYPVFIYIITKAVNEIDELKVSQNDQGELVKWNFLSPCYTIFQRDDDSFTNIWTDYATSFSDFNAAYLSDVEKYIGVKEFMAKPNMPGNTFPISCIPWLDFTSFNLNIYNDAKYLSPIFTMGKYTKKKEAIELPLSIQLHHALCDGYHAGKLVEAIRRYSQNFEDWLEE